MNIPTDVLNLLSDKWISRSLMTGQRLGSNLSYLTEIAQWKNKFLSFLEMPFSEDVLVNKLPDPDLIRTFPNTSVYVAATDFQIKKYKAAQDKVLFEGFTLERSGAVSMRPDWGYQAIFVKTTSTPIYVIRTDDKRPVTINDFLNDLKRNDINSLILSEAGIKLLES